MKTRRPAQTATKRSRSRVKTADERYSALASAWKRFSARITEIHDSLDGYSKQ